MLRYTTVVKPMARLKTSLSLDRALHARIKQEAKRQRRSVSSLVEIWIEDELLSRPAAPSRARNGKKEVAS